MPAPATVEYLDCPDCGASLEYYIPVRGLYCDRCRRGPIRNPRKRIEELDAPSGGREFRQNKTGKRRAIKVTKALRSHVR